MCMQHVVLKEYNDKPPPGFKEQITCDDCIYFKLNAIDLGRQIAQEAYCEEYNYLIEGTTNPICDGFAKR